MLVRNSKIFRAETESKSRRRIRKIFDLTKLFSFCEGKVQAIGAVIELRVDQILREINFHESKKHKDCHF